MRGAHAQSGGGVGCLSLLSCVIVLRYCLASFCHILVRYTLCGIGISDRFPVFLEQSGGGGATMTKQQLTELLNIQPNQPSTHYPTQDIVATLSGGGGGGGDDGDGGGTSWLNVSLAFVSISTGLACVIYLGKVSAPPPHLLHPSPTPPRTSSYQGDQSGHRQGRSGGGCRGGDGPSPGVPFGDGRRRRRRRRRTSR